MGVRVSKFRPLIDWLSLDYDSGGSVEESLKVLSPHVELGRDFIIDIE